MTQDELKEANRIFWIVKGHLIPEHWNDSDIISMQNEYIRRMWGNHEAVFHEVGFEEAWQKRMNRIIVEGS